MNTEIKCCPSCSFPLPPSEVELALTPTQSRLFRILKRAGARGVEGSMLMDLLYQDDPNGGPESTNIINVMKMSINRRLAPFGLAIRATARGPGARHSLVKV